MILIADGGSTKTHWALITKDLNIKDFYSEGYNPYFVDTPYIITSLTEALPTDIITTKVEKIYFYGAGVHNTEKAEVLSAAFKSIFTNASTYIDNDLLASCRALLGDNPGFAAILGTGTNTCLYDGTTIAHKINSAAYILGDEGSGCYLGKKLLIDFVRGRLPKHLEEAFNEKYKISASDILDRIYTKPLANRFCASFSQFLYDHLSDSYASGLVEQSFEDFFRQLVSGYPNYETYEFNSVGSVGFYFQDILTRVAAKYGMATGKIIKSPMEGLLQYHKKLILKENLLLA
ncbi:N-acetylglucosamine kinase [Pedobacter sp. SYSU D00535]|uniref:N-acetylglucosamine kinase n=1 Tax=Pedobacter sp. SYSU D00535 TaxID=2810308 RepID=UPI001A95C95E|nr:N-acetylglucosamine kinase [Pedobacter sp. SYSU D00535]